MIPSSRRLLTIRAVFFLFVLSLLFYSQSAAMVRFEDVNNLADHTKRVIDTFYRDSFLPRMQYEYSGEFISSEHREKLKETAEGASNRLSQILSKQEVLKKQIEEYEGEDWDELYGKTGLWRKLSWDIYTTKLARCRNDYFVALALEGTAQTDLLKQLVEKTEMIDSDFNTADSKMLKAKVYAALSKKEPDYRELAFKELELFMIFSDVEHPVSAAIIKLNMMDDIDSEQINMLINILSQNRDKRYLELVLSVAFLQRRHNPKGLDKILELFPEIESLISTLSLNDLSVQYQQNRLSLDELQQKSILEIELAAQTAWEAGAKEYRNLFEHILKVDKFYTPLVTYAAAASVVDSSPSYAVALLMKAADLQERTSSTRLPISAPDIAEQGARLAFTIFTEDVNYCEIAIEAFINCFERVDDSLDEELKYQYAVLLRECGRAEEGKKLLMEIADGKQSQWRDKAVIELAVDAIREKKYQTIEQQEELLSQVIVVLNKEQSENFCDYAEYVLILLEFITEHLEEVEIQVKDFSLFLSHLLGCAEFCYGCLEDSEKYSAGLLWGELLAFTSSTQTEKFYELERFLHSEAVNAQAGELDELRYMARMSMAKGLFSESAKKWARICTIRKDDAPLEDQKSWKWWRAKYYELYCCLHIAEFDKNDLMHTIDILEAAYSDIPHLWAEKLNSLKNQSQQPR